MCKIVYLTSKRFDNTASVFKEALAKELHKRKINVVIGSAFDLFNIFRKHKTYGIAIGVDFYDDFSEGRGLVLNKHCSVISRDFAYNVSNNLDKISPSIPWKHFDMVDSYDNTWYRFFNKVSSRIKVVFYLCTKNNETDINVYEVTFEKIVENFADEIVRCLRSDFNTETYRKKVLIAKQKKKKY